MSQIEGNEVRTKKAMKPQTFANVWDVLEDSPEDAATMTMRSDAMAIINTTVRGWNTTQAQAARRLGITQPRLNDLLKGKISKFSLDTLLTLATRAGLKVKINVRAAA
jgi:predicted XRE-type DNA-binding protein